MIAILSASSPAQVAIQRNAALKRGLPFEATAHALQHEVTFQNPEKVLGIVKEAGGRVSGVRPHRKMTRQEML